MPEGIWYHGTSVDIFCGKAIGITKDESQSFFGGFFSVTEFMGEVDYVWRKVCIGGQVHG
ncbi:hypothetical protein AALC75_20060 [Lachnospiraceae bacterium 48-42]